MIPSYRKVVIDLISWLLKFNFAFQIVDGESVTGVRTALASAVATKVW